MLENNLIEIALENLWRQSHIKATWHHTDNESEDGNIIFDINNHQINFKVEVKRELRQYQLKYIIEQASLHSPLLIICNSIGQNIKEQLRNHKISYLESNGNLYIHNDPVLIQIEMAKTVKQKKEKNRAFTKTGLKVIFFFLHNKANINLTYRDIAAKTNVALGNINYVINGLKQAGFILKVNKDNYQIIDSKKLLEKWVWQYEQLLKPSLFVGQFSFVDSEIERNWRMLAINPEKTVWGGEPAGDFYTNYLRPEKLTLYTSESRIELMKNYRLIPNPQGNVTVYSKFWVTTDTEIACPPVIAYADLINVNDKRCNETAMMIYEQAIEPNL